MSKQEALYDVHQEHAEWISKLNFYKDDIKIFNTRLEEIVSKNNGVEVLEEVERFQNQFIIQRNNIDEIAHIITLDEVELQNEVKANPVAVDHRKVGDQSEHRDLVTTFEKNFTKLRAEYNLFSSKWM
jgi:hypothetical protein